MATRTATKNTEETETETAPAAPANLVDQLFEKATTVEAARVFTEKKALVGVPFIITSWSVIPSESNGLSRRNLKYAEVNYVTKSGKTGTFRDASTKGIRAQLIASLRTDVTEGTIYDKPILVPEGIEVRTFTTENADGKDVEGTLYALSGHDS